MGEPGSRQHTPQVSPQPNPQAQPSGYKYEQLRASRYWDDNEVLGLQLDLYRPPRYNLVCFQHFCPDWS